jgi:hypothetical protein
VNHSIPANAAVISRKTEGIFFRAVLFWRSGANRIDPLA